jgi:hypothetical protein
MLFFILTLFFSLPKHKKMSILNQPFLQNQLDHAITLYNDQILPRLTKKTKVIAISTAVALSVVFYVRDTVFKPPKNLRHIPYIGYFSKIKSILIGESYWDRVYRVKLPLLESKDHNGLILVIHSR